jgi:ABC-type nickel/cobalt efflux system permease component RcnA
VSVALGAVVVAVGLQLRKSVESAQSAIVGSLLIATGALFLLLEAKGHPGHRHPHGYGHTNGHGHDHDQRERDAPTHGPTLLAFVVSFGAAASPDLTILPVFLAATAAGVGAAVGSLAVFAAVTVATFVVLTLVATLGGYRLGGAWLEKSGNLTTAGMLLLLGVLVFVGVI